MDRLEKLLFGIDRTARLLEVGPSHNPVAPKADGWHSFVLDHASQEDLRKKYQGHDVAHERIEPVDFVWTGGPIHDAVPNILHGSFNACVASHVLEHLPDPIGFFASLDRLLTGDGIVSLAVPDKRYCFDYFRPLTLAPGWIEAFEHKSTRHSRRSALEAGAYLMSNGDRSAWGQFDKMRVRLCGELEQAKRNADAAAQSDSEAYVDCHAWCFTPSSFELLVLELGSLGLIGFRIAKLFPTEGCEFVVSLRKGRDDYAVGIQDRRLQLLEAMVNDLGDQSKRMKRQFRPQIVRRGVGKIKRIIRSAVWRLSASKQDSYGLSRLKLTRSDSD
ncbi:MAG TPA: methyltransferase domain-containing protein [Steroidobacteraceae bacterium]